MKRKILMIGTALLMSVSLIACGKNGNDLQTKDKMNVDITAETEEQTIASEIAEELTKEDKAILSELAEEISKSEESDLENVKQNETAEYSSDFVATQEIIDASFEEGKVQVGKDMIFQLLSMNFEEVDKIVKNSSEAERYEWGEYSKYVPDDESIELKLDGKNYVVFHFRNIANRGDAKTTIEKCSLTWIQTKNFPGYVYYAGGICSNGAGINFDNIEQLFSDYEVDDTVGDTHTVYGYSNIPNTWKYEDTNLWAPNHVAYKLNLVSPYKYSGLGKPTPYTYFYVFAIDLDSGECSIVDLVVTRSAVDYDKLGLNADNYAEYVDVMNNK